MIVYSVALLAVAIVLVLRYFYSYWERHGVPNIKPHIPFGNLQTVVRKQESFGIAICELCRKTTGRLVGIYLFFKPAILIRDAHLAHRIMTTDFNSFHDRGVYCNEKGDPFSAHLFALPGKRWRNLRNKFTPIFTSGQLRQMMPTILHVGNKLQKSLEKNADAGEVIEMRNVVSRYVMEIVASVFFGFEANCIANPEDSFSTALKEAQRPSLSTNFRTAATFVCPELLKIVRTTALPSSIIQFVTEIITKQIEHREQTKTTRKDFIQQLINLRQSDNENQELSLSIGQCAANVFLFYAAGSETSSATITFTLHELTHNLAVMQRLVQEIDQVMEKHNNEISYDMIKEMKFLDKCVKETLRKYPGLPILNRECTEDYQVPDSDIVIRKGTQVIIPLEAYGLDEQYFSEPHRYNPDRFDEATKEYDEKAYYPFGEGPRNCIGIRMGVNVSKVGLILLLSEFNFEATIGPKINYSASSVTLVPKDGIPMKITRRK
ncbi:cytochrome P450 6d3-like [Uranotaenia lowii]|uniref:cytochrome P450 6d3-like n=1 Tax=Uranotaenia lowii TaxID=190385 RepID=UPI002478F5DE|nr:cytochrome P450 6d3-like [Uranotaenia lowii]